MTIKIDQMLFMLTFEADADYHANIEETETYLDRTTGIIFTTATDVDAVALIYGESAAVEMKQARQALLADPDRYLLIPSMSHSEHHAVLQNFLVSNWSDSQEARSNAAGQYYGRKSIGAWLKDVENDAAIRAYDLFRSDANQKLTETFFRKNGIVDYVWK